MSQSLTLAWAFQTGQPATLKSSPLLVNGILYFTVPDNVWAVDARSGHQIWHYTYPPNKGLHIGHRGVAMYKDWLYFTTPDAHLISLDAKNGKVRWNVQSADIEKGYWTTMAPLVVARSRDRRRLRRFRQPAADSCARSIPRPARRSGNGTARRPSARRTPPRAA